MLTLINYFLIDIFDLISYNNFMNELIVLNIGLVMMKNRLIG